MLHAHQAANSHHPKPHPLPVGGGQAEVSTDLCKSSHRSPCTAGEAAEEPPSLFRMVVSQRSCRQTGPSVPRLRKYCGRNCCPSAQGMGRQISEPCGMPSTRGLPSSSNLVHQMSLMIRCCTARVSRICDHTSTRSTMLSEPMTATGSTEV